MGIKKIGYILGRRIRGDMEMDLDPETGLFGAIIGPGARIAERPSQSYDEASNTQNYRIGSRMMLDDRVFRYAMAGDTLCPGYGAKNTIPQHVGFAAIGGCTEGEYTVVVTVGGTDGILGDGVIGEDELEGGYLVIFTPGNNAINRRVVGNTATTGAGPMTVTVDRPWPLDVANTEHAEIMASPYLNVQTGHNPVASVMGMPTQIATVNQYIWIQTWGPVWIVPAGDVSVGDHNRSCVFGSNGGIFVYEPADPGVMHQQFAGYVLCNARGGGQGAPFVQLMLSP